jgi:hypothetical protein
MLKLLRHVLTSPLRGWGHFVRLCRDRHARLVAGWFFAILGVIAGLSYMATVNSGLGNFFRGCAADFSEARLAALLMITPIAFLLALSSVGEATRWMDARRRGHRYNLGFFWKLAGLACVLLLASYLLGRC